MDDDLDNDTASKKRVMKSKKGLESLNLLWNALFFYELVTLTTINNSVWQKLDID